ncbi:hypothetical protein K449DRAFT_427402 [Hypoxylon sp. EC38]|nr:hypothetical protein K449DRAFT_427402 [Hypoxylon sp. EC38]
MLNISSSGSLDPQVAREFWKLYALTQYCESPAYRYGVGIHTFINTVNSFNRIELPLQNHWNYLGAVIKLSEEHKTLGSLSESLRQRQRETVTRIHDESSHLPR